MELNQTISIIILLVTIIATIIEIGELLASEISLSWLSYIVRYIFLLILFWNLQVFENSFMDFIFLKAFSIASLLYVFSYSTVGAIMGATKIYSPTLWKIVYFVIFIIFALILKEIHSALVSSGILPIVLNF